MPPVSSRKKNIAQRLAESEKDMPKAHMGVLLDIMEESESQSEALESLLQGQKEQNSILSEIAGKEASEVNFEPLVTSIDDVYMKVDEVRSAIAEIPRTDLSGVEALLYKIATTEPEKIDLSQLNTISAILDGILGSIDGLKESSDDSEVSDGIKSLLAVANTLNENLLSIPELDYDKLAEIIKKSVSISISAGGGNGVIRNASGTKINPATAENQTNGDQIANPSLGQGKTLLFGVISQSVAGTDQLVSAQGTGIKIYVVSYVFTINAVGTVKFTGSSDLTGAMTIVENGGAVVIGSPSSPVLSTGANQALSIVSTGGAVKGHFSYFVE